MKLFGNLFNSINSTGKKITQADNGRNRKAIKHLREFGFNLPEISRSLLIVNR